MKSWTALGITAAVLLYASGTGTTATAAGGASMSLSSSGFVTGQTAMLVANGDPGAAHFLLFDTVPGDVTLRSGAWIGLGFSPSFLVLDITTVESDGTNKIYLSVPDNPVLDGFSFHLQAMEIDPTFGVKTSNRVDEVVVAPNSSADWYCTPTTATNLATGVVTAASNPIEWAYGQSQPGDVIEVSPGSHPKFNLDKPWSDGQPMTTIRAQVPGTVKILRHNVGGSPTINVINAGFVQIEDLWIEGSDVAGVLCQRAKTGLGHKSVHFVNCTIDGGWDWYQGSGLVTKWGVLGWDFNDFKWSGGAIQNIKLEHAFYLHNCLGDITIENMSVTHVGRTAVQITARNHEGPVGIGNIVVRNVTATDCNLGDYFGGGSTFTFAGRHTGSILLDGVVTRAGFDPALNAVAGKVVGTGAFVSHYGDGSANTPNGPITLQNCVFELAPGAGDRDHVQVDATTAFTMSNCQITAGARQAMFLTWKNAYPVAMDTASQVTGSCTVDGAKYNLYTDMVKAMGW